MRRTAIHKASQRAKFRDRETRLNQLISKACDNIQTIFDARNWKSETEYQTEFIENLEKLFREKSLPLSEKTLVFHLPSGHSQFGIPLHGAIEMIDENSKRQITCCLIVIRKSDNTFDFRHNTMFGIMEKEGVKLNPVHKLNLDGLPGAFEETLEALQEAPSMINVLYDIMVDSGIVVQRP